MIDKQGFEKYLKELEQELIEKYGHLLSRKPLANLLGYQSVAALEKGILRSAIPIPVFSIEQRRGKFALTKDVAKWLAEKRFKALEKLENKEVSID